VSKLIMKRIVSAVALSIVSVVSMEALADPAAGERLAEKWLRRVSRYPRRPLVPQPGVADISEIGG
jgi:hypothetical protein